MTWFKSVYLPMKRGYAAIFAAYFFSVCVALAQDATFSTDDRAILISGQFLAFDGEAVTLLTENGLTTFRADGMSCAGAECPDLDNYVPQLRMVGDRKMADLLLPALIDAYARDTGAQLRETARGSVLRARNGQELLRITIAVASPDAAFETFVDHRADILLSTRELRAAELDAALDAGLGRLSLATQARIIALDALIPVVSPSSDLRFISLARLSRALTSADPDLSVHLPDMLDGQLQGFEDRFLKPVDLALADPDVAHSTRTSLIAAIEQGNNGLSLVPFGEAGNTQPLGLSGPCGLISDARFLSMKTEDYPLTFPMFLYLPQRAQHPNIDDFLDWMRSPAAQLVIRRAGFVDLAAVPIPLSEQGDRLANAISNAGTEVPLRELQRMVRLLAPRVRMSSTFRFEPGSTRLDGQSRSNVMQLAQAIRDGRFGGQELVFVGFSDGLGPALANRDLSSARADAVRRDVVRALGGEIPPNVVMDTDAFGEAMPMACDDTIWGQQANRRVELWVRELD